MLSAGSSNFGSWARHTAASRGPRSKRGNASSGHAVTRRSASRMRSRLLKAVRGSTTETVNPAARAMVVSEMAMCTAPMTTSCGAGTIGSTNTRMPEISSTPGRPDAIRGRAAATASVTVDEPPRLPTRPPPAVAAARSPASSPSRTVSNATGREVSIARRTSSSTGSDPSLSRVSTKMSTSPPHDSPTAQPISSLIP